MTIYMSSTMMSIYIIMVHVIKMKAMKLYLQIQQVKA